MQWEVPLKCKVSPEISSMLVHVHHCTTALQYSDEVVQWYSHAVLQLCSGTVTQWYSHAVVQCYSCAVV